jgi:anti-sigma factor (TIGR02949 family)
MTQIDCEQAVEHLYELLDRELTPALEGEVREHIESCPQCFPLYRFEAAFKRFLKAHAAMARVPEALRRRIFDHVILEDGGGEA